jgi:hypothetical protein
MIASSAAAAATLSPAMMEPMFLWADQKPTPL